MEHVGSTRHDVLRSRDEPPHLELGLAHKSRNGLSLTGLLVPRDGFGKLKLKSTSAMLEEALHSSHHKEELETGGKGSLRPFHGNAFGFQPLQCSMYAKGCSTEVFSCVWRSAGGPPHALFGPLIRLHRRVHHHS